MKALVTGATGFIGGALVARLEKPRVLSRTPDRAKALLGAVEAFPWDAERGEPPAEALEGVEVVFHLAGESVAAGRWTRELKHRIRDSRVVGTRNLVGAIARAKARPRVLVAASAVGIYGDRGDEGLTEASPPGAGFLADTCAAWEEAARAAEAAGVRVVSLRIGVVLGRGGGALAKMLLPFRLGLGSPLGSGRQWMPWIHRDDVLGLALLAAGSDAIRGPVNAVAPAPSTNREFTKALGRALGRPTFLPPVPGFVLRAGMGQFADVLLASQKVIPARAREAGYAWRQPALEAALRESVG